MTTCSAPPAAPPVLALILASALGACSSDVYLGIELPRSGASGKAGDTQGSDGSARSQDASIADTDPSGSAGRSDDADASQRTPGDNGTAGTPAGSHVPFEGEGQPWIAAAPRASCRPGDHTDGTISGLSEDLRCNLDLVAQVAAPHFLGMAWHDNCAYVNGSDGTTVIRVEPDGTPTVVTTLTTLGFRGNWESMKASDTSGLLAGYEANGSTLTVYDTSKDCANPELQSSIKLNGLTGGSWGHAGSFSPDGTIYYASSQYTTEVFAVDFARPTVPSVITTSFEATAHDLFIGKQGTRGYFAVPDVVNKGLGYGSFAVIDLTQVQARAPNAKGTRISSLSWDDGSLSLYPILVTYRGRDHLFIDDELGSGNCDNPDKPQWGYGRIFDLSDEKKPRLASLIKTEAHEPANCQAASMAEGSTSGFGVSTHYCNVDRLEDPRLLSCSIQNGGVRVYDIRNPWRPKEVAYFSTTSGAVPGMQRIHVDRRELWLASQPGTFYVMKFSPGSAADQILSN